MFLPVQPITQFTQAEIYLLPFRFIGRLLSPINSRQLELQYSLPSDDGQTRKKFKTKMKIRAWKAGTLGRVAKHRKIVLFIGHGEEGEFQYYTWYSSSYMHWPQRTAGKRWQPQNYRPGNMHSFRQSFVTLFLSDHLTLPGQILSCWLQFQDSGRV